MSRWVNRSANFHAISWVQRHAEGDLSAEGINHDAALGGQWRASTVLEPCPGVRHAAAIEWDRNRRIRDRNRLWEDRGEQLRQPESSTTNQPHLRLDWLDASFLPEENVTHFLPAVKKLESPCYGAASSPSWPLSIKSDAGRKFLRRGEPRMDIEPATPALFRGYLQTQLRGSGPEEVPEREEVPDIKF